MVYFCNIEEGLDYPSDLVYIHLGTEETCSLGRLTCHFRQLGLNDGRPAAASRSVLKMYRLGIREGFGDLCGSGFAG